MSDKKNTVTESSGKVMTSYDKKVQRRKEQEARAKKEALQSKITTAVVALLLVAFIAYFPISTHIATTSTYAKVGENEITQVEFDYYYNFGFINFVNQNSYLLSYLGLDTNAALDQQMYGEYTTWDDYFQQTAINNIMQTKALVAEGKAKGFEHDTTAEVEAHIQMLEDSANSAGTTLKNYISTTFGKHATVKRITPILEESYYAAAYYEKVSKDQDVTEEEITEYYSENKNSYDSVDFKLITVNAEIPQGESTVDEEGNAKVADPTQEQIAEAMAAAKEKADKQLLFVEADGEVHENVKMSGVSYYYSEWLFNEERKAGDTTVIEDNTNHCYYVLSFTDRYLDETKAVTARVIMTTADNSAAIEEEFKANGSTEDAFIALVEKYSEDTYTNTNGGLYENITASALSEELGDWLLGERAYGDMFTAKGSDGYYYALYFVEQGQEEWKVDIDYILRSSDMSDYMTSLMDGIEVVDVKGKLTYEENLAKEEEAAASKEAEESKTE